MAGNEASAGVLAEAGLMAIPHALNKGGVEHGLTFTQPGVGGILTKHLFPKNPPTVFQISTLLTFLE